MMFFLSLCILHRPRPSDDDTATLAKRTRHDSDSSKSKKKHKKHKKHKKSKKHGTDERDRTTSKKHKKHRKNSTDGNISDTNSEVSMVRVKATSTMPTAKSDAAEAKVPAQTTSTLSAKFTEIMKSNGHVVVAKVPTTKFNNGNPLPSENVNKRSSQSSSHGTTIPTEPSELVAFITRSLDPNVSTQVISSASESGSVRDVDSPDVTVIEEDDDLNLEELMRQKALLQARLGKYRLMDHIFGICLK